jgi:hypothetical protein
MRTTVASLLALLILSWPGPSDLVARDAPAAVPKAAGPTFPGRYMPPRPTDQPEGN